MLQELISLLMIGGATLGSFSTSEKTSLILLEKTSSRYVISFDFLVVPASFIFVLVSVSE